MAIPLSGGAAGRADSLTGLKPQFREALEQLISAAPGPISVSSGYRSPELQRQLFANAIRKYGSEQAARKWVAPPGKSRHNHGTGADLRFGSPEARQWAHANAARFGLNFRMGHEPWHIEYAGDLSGGGGTETMQGGIRESSQGGLSEPDKLEAPKWTEPNFDPKSGGSKHAYRFDASTGRGQYKTSDGRIIDYFEPQGDRQSVASSLRGRPLFGPASSDARIPLKPGFTRFFGIGQEKDDDTSYWTKSERKKLEARYGADWESEPRDVLLKTIYPDPKTRTSTSSSKPDRVMSIPANAEDEIGRLAGLDPIAYERERQRIADKWGVRVQTVDRAVTSRRTELRKQQRSENTPVNSNVVRGGVSDKVIQNAMKMANAGTPIEQIEAGLRKIGIDPAQFRKALGR
jgi:hypothetical protein